MKHHFIITSLLFLATITLAQKDSIKSQIPFEGQDQTWQNGSDRRDSAVLQTKYFI